MSKKLYVGNLPFSATEDSLREAFARFGTVESVNIITDRDTGQSKGFGFIELSSKQEAAEAIEIQAPATSPYIGRPLRDIRLPRDAIVAAIARMNGEVIVPRGDDTIEAGDRVVFVALEHCVSELETAFLAKPRSRWLRP